MDSGDRVVIDTLMARRGYFNAIKVHTKNLLFQLGTISLPKTHTKITEELKDALSFNILDYKLQPMGFACGQCYHSSVIQNSSLKPDQMLHLN